MMDVSCNCDTQGSAIRVQAFPELIKQPICAELHVCVRTCRSSLSGMNVGMFELNNTTSSSYAGSLPVGCCQCNKPINEFPLTTSQSHMFIRVRTSFRHSAARQTAQTSAQGTVLNTQHSHQGTFFGLIKAAYLQELPRECG